MKENLGALHIDLLTHMCTARTHRRHSTCPHEFGIYSLMMLSLFSMHVLASSAVLRGVLVRKQRGPNPNYFWICSDLLETWFPCEAVVGDCLLLLLCKFARIVAAAPVCT